MYTSLRCSRPLRSLGLFLLLVDAEPEPEPEPDAGVLPLPPAASLAFQEICAVSSSRGVKLKKVFLKLLKKISSADSRNRYRRGSTIRMCCWGRTDEKRRGAEHGGTKEK